MMEHQKDFSDYANALRRRLRLFLTIAGSVFVLALLLAVLWPPVYRSTATILIEEQTIPQDLIRSTVTSYAWQRIQEISQRVMTRATLLGIVEKYNLYPRKRLSETSEQIVERMRKDIRLDAISADVIDPRTGRPTPATIAFTLAFESESGVVAQQVASELATLYMNENLKSRSERASETYGFLTDEAEKLNQQIAELEKKISTFKEKNTDRLPELSSLNMQLIDRTERELIDIQSQMQNLDERRFYLEGQLAQLNPASPMFGTAGERILDADSRLKVLKTELAAARARYSADHPDVVRMAREIEGLEKQSGQVRVADEQAKALAGVRAKLAEIRKSYSADHPDVQRLTKEVATLEAAVKDSPAVEANVAVQKPENPAYIALQSQLEGVNSQMRATEKRRHDLKNKLAEYERRIALAPGVEREYLELKRDHDNAQLKYREIKAKQLEAQVGQSLEKERKGERFELIDPPQLPETPVRPNRMAIILLGLVLALGGGVGTVFVAESLSQAVGSPRAVTALMGAAPLAVIPYVENREDRERRERKRRFAFRSAVAGAFAFALIVQFFWLPWDVLWYKGIRKIFGG